MSHCELVKSDSKVVNHFTVYRVRATTDFKNPYRDVKKGELGGYVNTLDTLGKNSWVFGNAILLASVRLGVESYVVGDFIYNNIVGTKIEINSNKDMYKHTKASYVSFIKVEGYIPGTRHPVVFGKCLKNSREPKYNKGDNIIFVGCTPGTIQQWKNKYKRMARDYDYGYQETEYANYLKQIETFYSKPVDNNVSKLEQISSNISTMKVSVTEALKTETISLISSLEVSQKVVVQSGPKRCPKTGRWLKKNP